MLTVVVVVLVALEAATRVVVIPASRIERRTDAEEMAAARPGPRGRRSLLVVGNSLLLNGVDMSSVESRLRDWRVDRFVVEQTSYLDWVYGLRRLAARGAHPTVVAVMLDPGQLATSAVRGDYSALRLVRLRDVLWFGVEAGYHPTEVSRLVLSNLSAFYGFRSESRKVLLARLLPGMEDLSRLLAPRRAVGSGGGARDYPVQDVSARLVRLRKEVESRDGRLVLVVPPLPGSVDAIAGVEAAARLAEVPVIVAFTPGAVPPGMFSDGYHLNERGMRAYSPALAASLQSVLERLTPGAPTASSAGRK